MTIKRIAIALVVAAAIGAFLFFDLGRVFSFEALQSLREDNPVVGFIDANPYSARAIYFSIYVVLTGLSLPVAGVMTLAGGAIFGLWWGLALTSFASSVGATLAFLVSRSLLGEWVQERFAKELASINTGVERDGSYYLFSIRMAPLIPFVAVNLVMGLTRMGAASFYIVSQIGMLAGTFVYVLAGTRLAEVRGAGDILDPVLIAALALLGLFPLAAKKLMERINRHRGGTPAPARAPEP